MAKETLQFQAETQQILNLVINSIYSNKEIFIRELISNSSDALDKLRYKALTNADLIKDEKELAIGVDRDKKARTVTIHDNGIGMSKEDLMANLGVIAHSGTKELLEKLKDKKDFNADLIGQFGIGFYSAFIVADKVSVLTKVAGTDVAYLWESDGSGEYTIEESEKEKNGTSITLHLKDTDDENGLEDFTEQYVLERVIKKYSNFISYPIIIQDEITEVEKDKDGKPIEGGKETTRYEDKTVNSMKPIWAKSKSEIKDEEYNEFYKHISHDWADPAKAIPVKAEGVLEYQALLFIPSKAPMDLYYATSEVGIQLYVKRVLIVEKSDDILPKYLRFIKGVVECNDIPLNVSREMLQQDKYIIQIKKRLTKKVLDTLKTMQAKEEDKFLEVWKEFGPALKEGISMEFENKDKLINLFMFESSNDKKKLTSLKDYLSRMKSDQKEIYYITGESREILENSPHLEAFESKGYEVLYLVDPVDELLVSYMNEYEGKSLKSIGKGKVDLGDEKEKKESEEKLKEKEKDFKDLFEVIQKELDENIKEVRLSSRLVKSPVCLVSADEDISPHLEKLLANTPGAQQSKTKRILEINPDHEILKKMQSLFDTDKKDDTIKDYSELLLGYAYLAEGQDIPDKKKFNSVIAKLMI